MFRILDHQGVETRTVSFREWVTAGRAQRLAWSHERRTAKTVAKTSSDARAAAKAAESASHRGQAQGFSGGGV
jgi:hypothetical protein